MSVVQRKAMLKAEGFFPHKKNGKGTSIIYSRKHPTAKFVRVVVDSGIDSKTGKVIGKVGVKLCFINRQKQWREITTEVFTTNTGLVKTIKAQEAAEKFVKICKHCKAKKFTAKSGNVVCANACWTNWSGNKKKTTQKTSPKKPQKNPPKIKAQKSSQKNPPKIVARAINANRQRKKRQKIQEKWTINLQPGDLVTVVECTKENNITTDYSGKILGIVASVDTDSVYGNTKVQWTVNTSSLEEWELPKYAIEHRYASSLSYNRFKVISRKVNWVKA